MIPIFYSLDIILNDWFDSAETSGSMLVENDIEGFTDGNTERAISAAKNPQLEMKLKNMPIPLNVSLLDECMRPILEAAKFGDLSIIKNLEDFIY